MSLSILAWATAPWSPSSYSVLVSRTIPNWVRDSHQCTLGTWYGLQGQPLPWQIKPGKLNHIPLPTLRAALHTAFSSGLLDVPQEEVNEWKMQLEETPDERLYRFGGRLIDSFYGVWDYLKNTTTAGVVNVLPAIDGAGYAKEAIIPTYRHFGTDCLITISDVWVFPKDITGHTVFCPWMPIDMDPTPQPILESLQSAVYPMIYSKWGVDILAKDGVKAHYVPGSAPADVFKPGDRQAAREAIHFPDNAGFVVAMVSANKDPLDRKGFAEGLTGFARFAEKHPDAMLYLHTNWDGAIDIKSLVKRLGIEKQIIQPDPFGLAMGMLNDQYMALAYQASDVLLNPCKSEGFGLPIIEAQMCGIPVAATDFATTDELLFAGWKIKGQADWSNGLNSWRVRVYIDSVVDALEEAYANRGNEKLAQKARNGAMRFDNDTVFNQYWRPALRDIEAIVSKAKVAMPKVQGSGARGQGSVNGKAQGIDAKIEALEKAEV